METYEVKLPVFNGTYGNYWDDFVPCDETGDNLSYERYDIDHKKMMESIAEAVIDYIETYTDLWEVLGVKDAMYKNYYSPKEYNFANDKIYLYANIDTKILSKYVYANKDIYTKEIYDHHTSRDGFVSFISNDIKEWEEETENFTNFEEKTLYYLDFILQIAAEIEGIEELSAYYHWCETVCQDEFCTIYDLTWETVDLEQIFIDNVDKIDWEYGDTQFIKADAVRKADVFGTDWLEELDDKDKINLLESIGLEPEQFEYVKQ